MKPFDLHKLEIILKTIDKIAVSFNQTYPYNSRWDIIQGTHMGMGGPFHIGVDIVVTGANFIRCLTACK